MTPKPSSKSYTLAIGPGYRVDRERGLLRGVALITGDREAKGHGFYIDQLTISGAGAAVAARGGILKAGIRHASLQDWVATGGDRILDLPGWFSSLAVKGNQLVGDMEFYDSFKTAHPEDFAHLLEIAEKTPQLVGLSIEVSGYAVFVAEDGTEYSERPKDVPLKYDGLPALRVTDLSAAAFVDEPAANDGLFARLSAGKFAGKQPGADPLRHLFASFLAWTRAHPELHAFPSAPTGEQSGAPALSQSNKTNDTTMTILAALKAKFGADKARLSRAIEFLAEDETLSVESIEAKLAAADQAAMQATVTQLTADKTTLSAQVADLTAKLTAAHGERDQWKQKYEALKATGLPAPVVLTATGGDRGTAAAPARLSSVDAWSLPGAIVLRGQKN